MTVFYLIVIPNLFRNLLNFWDPETSSGWQWCSVFKITTSLCIGYFILCSVTAPRLKRDSEPADLSCRQPIFSAGCFALCSACFPRNELLGVRGQSPSWLEPFDYSCFSFSVLLFLFASKSKRKSEQRELWDTSVTLFPQYDGIINYPSVVDYSLCVGRFELCPTLFLVMTWCK